EGTPDGYVPKEYPAVASLDVVNALVEAALAAGVRYHVGVMRSVDALYSDLVPDQMPRPDLRAELEMWTKAGVIGNDMETSTLYVVSRLRSMRAGTICLVVDEVGAGEIHHLDPSYMDRMLAVAVDAIRILIKRYRSAAARKQPPGRRGEPARIACHGDGARRVPHPGPQRDHASAVRGDRLPADAARHRAHA